MPLDNNKNTHTHTISWDIGIKNLAYCVLEQCTPSAPNHITFNNTTYQITNWADISLLSQITNNLADAGQATSLATKLICSCPKNDKINAPVCGALASYCHESLAPSGNYLGYCKSHFKKSGIARMPCVPVSKCYHHSGCTSKATHVLKNHVFIGYCKKHLAELTKSPKEGTERHTEADFLKINNVRNAGKIDINQLGMALFQELDKIKTIITNPDVILLENQPVLKNPTMKSMQMFLYSYYLMRILEGNQAKGISGLGSKYIQCYTASKKLDLIKFFPAVEQARIVACYQKLKTDMLGIRKCQS
jgi:Mitochondrial resolvase Ydc2 / RNA splicing MRS1